MNIRPLHNRILVKRAEAAMTTRGGLIVPEQARERPIRATVIAVGVRRNSRGERLPPLVKAGDQVLIGKYAGIEVREDGELLALVDESEVVGVYDRSKDADVCGTDATAREVDDANWAG